MRIIILAGFVFLLLMMSVLIVGLVEENERWNKFSVDHKCKKVGEISGGSSVGTGITIIPGGKMGTMIMSNTYAGKVGWLCDDGIIYWR